LEVCGAPMSTLGLSGAGVERSVHRLHSQ